jgi:hypothetical protein
MFQLHYKTRRFFCRVAFVLFCPLPTAGVLLWAGWLGSPAYVEASRREIEERFQVGAKLAVVVHPQPGTILYEGLELLDLPTGQRIVYLPRLEAWRSNEQLVLRLTGPEMEALGLTRLSTFLAEAQASKLPVTLLARSVLLRRSDRQDEFKDVRLRTARTTEGQECQLQFRLTTAEAGPVQLRIVRDFHSSALSHIELDTGGAELPCPLAAPLAPWLSHLGERATFAGTLQATRGLHGWEGDVQGNLANIDLARAIGANFPHRIEGLAKLRLQRTQIARSRLVEAVGSMTAGPGLIGPSLRIAASEALQLSASPAALDCGAILNYEQLAFDFTLDAGGISLIGRCSEAPGAVLVDRREALLGQPKQTEPVASLIRALAPGDAASVPATQQTAWLLELLPVASGYHEAR